MLGAMQEIERLASYGWKLHPCDVRDKTPRLTGWPNLASSDLATIRGWATQFPGCNWGVATGPVSGVFVLDVDGEEGRASLAELEAKHGTLPATLTSITGQENGGEHYWFNYPHDREIRNSKSKLGKGLDVRGKGGHVVVPPSIHPTGKPYQWVRKDQPPADVPAWLLSLVSTNKPADHRPEDFTIIQGQRTKTLHRIGSKMRGHACTLDQIESQLLKENVERCIPPLDEGKIRSLASDICLRYPPGAPPLGQNLPLSAFLRSAIQRNNLEYFGSSKWRSPLFVFARWVKGRQEFNGMDAVRAAGLIEQTLGVTVWEQFYDVSDDPRAQLIADWESARTTASDGDTLTKAWAEAQRCPVVPPKVYSEKYSQCISLFAALQKIAGPEKNFVGPQRRIAELLRVDSSMVGNYIKWAIADGVLARRSDYIPHQRAYEYRLDPSKFTDPVPPLESTLTKSHQERPERPRETKSTRTVGDSGDSGDSGENGDSGDVCEVRAGTEAETDFCFSEDEEHPECDIEAPTLAAGLEWAPRVVSGDSSGELSPESLAQEASMAALTQGCWDRERARPGESQ